MIGMGPVIPVHELKIQREGAGVASSAWRGNRGCARLVREGASGTRARDVTERRSGGWSDVARESWSCACVQVKAAAGHQYLDVMIALYDNDYFGVLPLISAVPRSWRGR
jgi:hypothetical protein